MQCLLYIQETYIEQKVQRLKAAAPPRNKAMNSQTLFWNSLSYSYYQYYYTNSYRLQLFPPLFLRNHSLGVGALAHFDFVMLCYVCLHLHRIMATH